MTTHLLSHTLRRLMFEANIRTTQLARCINLPQPTVHRIVTGSSLNPHQASLDAIANYFKISVAQLKGLEPIERLSTFIASDNHIDCKAVPLFDWNHPALWSNRAELIAQATGRELIYTDARVSNYAYALKLRDTSMEPQFSPGTVLIIDPEKYITNNCYVIVKLSQTDTVLFRQLLIDGSTHYAKSLHPNTEQSKLIRLSENDRICGVLAQTKRDY